MHLNLLLECVTNNSNDFIVELQTSDLESDQIFNCYYERNDTFA